MVHIIKVYFTGLNQTVQIRRLAVNSEVVSRYDLLVRKIREMFPVLAQGYVELTWKDSENDIIHMSSDEELAQALASADDDILRIYAHSLDNQQYEDKANHNLKSSHNEVHQNVICDGCDKTIQGFRYKCLQCRNFDLCSSCNAANKHETHDMIKLVRPTHISREWVFIGARKFWRSMFGRCPASYFAASGSADKKEQAEKPESAKKDWPGVLDDLLKGGYVSADKIIKENLGGFLNFIESVSGDLDIKLESDAPKQSPCNEKQDNKTDQKSTNNSSSNPEPTPSSNPESSSSPSDEELLNVLSEWITPKAAEQLPNSAASDTREKEHSAEPCGLFHNIDVEKTDKLSEDPKKDAAGDSIDKLGENSAKSGGLLGETESADGWTILNNQESDKKDATSIHENGAKPKYPNIYPCMFVNSEPSKMPQIIAEAKASAETKLKEVASSQPDKVQDIPKPAMQESDKFANLKYSENVASNCNPEIMNALVKMQAMGFTNEGGWLERLLLTKDGNINATLDALYPNTRRH